MRRGLSWLLTLPLALAGSQLAHALAYRLAVPDAHRRQVVLTETGHGYLSYWPLAAGLAGAAGLVALALHVRPGARRPLRAWPFLLLPMVTFALQEHLERFAHSGALSLAADRTFVVGLLLQLPFGLIAFAIARALLRVADRIAAALRAPRARLRPPAALAAAAAPPPRRVLLAAGTGARAPPAGA